MIRDGRWLTLLVALVISTNIGLQTVSANPFLKPAEGQLSAPPTQTGRALPDWLRDWQLAFKTEAGRLLTEYSQGGNVLILWAILASTFVYGLLHALGPGHRKAVVFSLFLGKKAPWWKPLAAGFLSAGIHGAMAIGIVGILSLIKQGISSLVATDQANAWVETGSAFLILGFSLALILLKLIRGHHEHGNGKGGLWSIIISTSLVPCPGATMVLLSALYFDMLAVGVLAVITMSLGMGLVVSGAAYLAWAGRTVLFKRLKAKEETVHKIADALEYAAYGFLLVIGILAVIPIIEYWSRSN